ncbi:hypothetical protein E5Q_01629 [Mixia osmundae IAM 14324]|uniref:Peptidase S28 n=2 Tax=Mixia osmundae (strain CBS 9802 / IAM 14324 / JCM 22182 / KY 12970) TaxID=764103 RepID=G7DWL4_MIXOS|nr:hypothetical protein E5Q_01629 [Mixia osmundae IAM 14324]
MHLLVALQLLTAVTALHHIGAFHPQHHAQRQRPDEDQALLFQTSNDASLDADPIKQAWHTLPLDHFNDSSTTFRARYWFDNQFYVAGGPVYILNGGETSGAGRLPFMRTGILRLMSEATGGSSIILEHRAYGKSLIGPDWKPANLKYLTTAQALADVAHFAQHANLSLPSGSVLSLSSVEHRITIGGSYAGAQSAFLRRLYPDIFFGAIASSAVTHAQVDFWQYMETIRLRGPKQCIQSIVDTVAFVDSMLDLERSDLTRRLQRVFGLENVTVPADFVNVLTTPLNYWQAANWDSTVGLDVFASFCSRLTSTDSAVPDALTSSLLPSYAAHASFNALGAYAAWIREYVTAVCPEGADQDACFGTYDDRAYQKDGPWRAWLWQVCTEWGYHIAAAPLNVTSLLSRRITLAYVSKSCQQSFGRDVPMWPNISRVNAYGDYGLSYDRLAFIDGQFDAWVEATPHASVAPPRNDTDEQPFWLIPRGGHHYDENGLLNRSAEPSQIKSVHARELAFIKKWLAEDGGIYEAASALRNSGGT